MPARNISRRRLATEAAALFAASSLAASRWELNAAEIAGQTDADLPRRTLGQDMQFGLVTYLWGKDLSLPALISVCTASQVLGVELRTTHQHGVEPGLTSQQRADVQARFNDSPVTLVGIGSNERFDSPDPKQLNVALEATKEFIRLSHDVGGSGVKVKGDRFYDDVPREKTIAQVVAALRSIGDYGAGFGQQIRLEIHGGFAEIATHFAIIKAVDHPNVRSCWNSNPQDLQADGLDAHFAQLRPYFGHTLHVRPLDSADYPFATLIQLLVRSNYAGWVLLEASGDVTPDQIAAKLGAQRDLFSRYVGAASVAC